MRTDLSQRPERWSEICGWYSPDPGPATNRFTRLFMGAGAEATVRRGRLLLRPLTPVPALRRAMEPHRADRDDPFVCTVDVSSLGNGAMPVVFSGFDRGTDTPMLLLNGMAFRTRPDLRNPRPWLNAAMSAGAGAGPAALAIGRRGQDDRLGPSGTQEQDLRLSRSE
jgi:hypothetical protein